MAEPLVVFCDTQFPADAHAQLVRGVAHHRLMLAAKPIDSNLRSSHPDPVMRGADVVFGQPEPAALLEARRLKWVHLTSAGYGRYDSTSLRDASRSRGFALTTASCVYADPCAEHVLAFMLAGARQLPECFADGRDHAWSSVTRRAQSFLLRGQHVLLLGWGAIARRLASLLEPFEVRLSVFRRTAGPCGIGARSTAPEPTRPPTTAPVQAITTRAALDAALAEADHVVDLLPENPQTLGLVDAERLARMKRSALFYNVGRGATVDQDALCRTLAEGGIGGAFLDVTSPEPLPADHPLWSAPRCVITPHSAGGRNTEHLALVTHFLQNLTRFEQGAPLLDRVM